MSFRRVKPRTVIANSLDSFVWRAKSFRTTFWRKTQNPRRSEQKTNLSTHVDDGPLLHHDGVVGRRRRVRLNLARLLEDEDAFY